MIEDDIRQLDGRGLDCSLDRLETDVWLGVTARARQRQAARRVTSFQGIVMAIALLGSVAAGIGVARARTATSHNAVLATGFELMPSNLLLSHAP